METQVSVIMKAQEMRSPYGDEFRGFRLLVAHPNLAGSSFGKSIPSFEKPFFISMFGDYESEAKLFSAIAIVSAALTGNGYKPRLLERTDKPAAKPTIDIAALEAEVELWKSRVEQLEERK